MRRENNTFVALKREAEISKEETEKCGKVHKNFNPKTKEERIKGISFDCVQNSALFCFGGGQWR